MWIDNIVDIFSNKIWIQLLTFQPNYTGQQTKSGHLLLKATNQWRLYIYFSNSFVISASIIWIFFITICSHSNTLYICIITWILINSRASNEYHKINTFIYSSQSNFKMSIIRCKNCDGVSRLEWFESGKICFSIRNVIFWKSVHRQIQSCS